MAFDSHSINICDVFFHDQPISSAYDAISTFLSDVWLAIKRFLWSSTNNQSFSVTYYSKSPYFCGVLLSINLYTIDLFMWRVTHYQHILRRISHNQSILWPVTLNKPISVMCDLQSTNFCDVWLTINLFFWRITHN